MGQWLWKFFVMSRLIEVFYFLNGFVFVETDHAKRNKECKIMRKLNDILQK